MPKANGLTAEQRKAMMDDETNPEDSPRDIAPTPVAPSYAPETPAIPVAPAAPMDTAALVQMLAAALSQSGQLQANAVADAVSNAAKSARSPVAETYLTGGYPEKSVYSHPDGDLAHPRTPLVCPMYLAVYDENRKAAAAFEYHQDTLKEVERVKLNAVPEGHYRVERTDDVEGVCMVVVQKDDLGQPIRKLFAVPQGWLAKDQFSQMPNLKNFLAQLLERETATAAA